MIQTYWYNGLTVTHQSLAKKGSKEQADAPLLSSLLLSPSAAGHRSQVHTRFIRFLHLAYYTTEKKENRSKRGRTAKIEA